MNYVSRLFNVNGIFRNALFLFILVYCEFLLVNGRRMMRSSLADSAMFLAFGDARLITIFRRIK